MIEVDRAVMGLWEGMVRVYRKNSKSLLYKTLFQILAMITDFFFRLTNVPFTHPFHPGPSITRLQKCYPANITLYYQQAICTTIVFIIF